MDVTRARIRSLVIGVLCAIALIVGGASPGVRAAESVPFTIVVLPDTQGYTVSTEFEQTMAAQTQWIVDSRTTLNTKFVVQVGDLVESWPNVNHWERASRYMKTLDDAGVPSSVLPGNHDLNITTGESSTYDTYFPPSRYANASWNSPEVRYGGYLGQNLFGPDEIDRKNKDNFALLSAGGVDLLILNLEFESPGYSMRWAQKVIDAHPDRKVILATHGFINTAGVRSTAVIRTDVTPTSAVTLWNDFVYRNCSIFMVVNGHWHDGDLGEARRTDANACGTPVHQILSDYQSRANGGNGWLRYYTFDPAAGKVDAFTYSPTLQSFETDANSRFTLDVDLSEGSDELLISGGSTWKYRNSTGPWPAEWNATTFDDTQWQQARAPLGWGAGATTNIDLGPPSSLRAVSVIYRQDVELSRVDDLTRVTITTRADDGVAVWVNGTLVGSAFLPTVNPTSTSYATAARSTSLATGSPLVFDVPLSLLRAGKNTVAASSHVNYRATADSTFDLVMTARRSSEPPVVEAPGVPVVSGTALGPSSVRVSWAPGAGGPVAGVEIARVGGPTVTASGASGTYTDTTAPPASAVEYGVVAVGPTGLRSAAAVVTVTTPPVTSEPVPVTLVAADGQWRYRYATGAWPAGWTTVAFDAAAWGTGAAPLGFGGGVATVVDVPPPTSSRPVSMIFRTGFTVADPAALSQLRLTVRADDGVVVYVNGTEVGRLRMPTGAVSSTTYATAAPTAAAAAAAPLVIDIPASLLTAGTNVIAASTHLNYRGTPNVSFTAQLAGTISSEPPVVEAPGVPVVSGTALGPSSVRVSWAPGAGGPVAGVEIARVGGPTVTASGASGTYTDTTAPPASAVEYGVVAVGPTGLRSAAAVVTVTTPPVTSEPVPVTLVAADGQWRYRYATGAWPAGWTTVAFDAAAWGTGAAPLGFGGGVATVVDVPPPTSSRPVSMIFRTGFTVADPAALSQLRLTVRADDGVVVYVNGTEVGRLRMPTGAVSSTTYATAAPTAAAAAAAPLVIDIPASLLTAGANVIAASTHLNYRATPNVSFTAQLAGMKTD